MFPNACGYRFPWFTSPSCALLNCLPMTRSDRLCWNVSSRELTRSFQPKEKSSRAREGLNTNRGAQLTCTARTTQLTTWYSSCWITSAHTPAPASAARHPMTPEDTAEAIVATNSLRSSRSRVTLATWTELYAFTTNMSAMARMGHTSPGIP